MTKHLLTLSSGQKIAYWSHHEDKKPTIVLVHGFTGSHEGFQYLVPLLTNFHLIIPDLPGFGVSPLPHNKLSLAEMGQLLVELVEELNLPRPPHLLGHSMGSLVVGEAARQHPGLFAKKLILISPVPSPVLHLDSRWGGAAVSKLYYAASHRLPRVGKKLATSKKLTRLSTHLIMTTKDKILRQKIHGHHFKNLEFISNIGWYRQLYKDIQRTGINRYRAALAPFDVLVINGDKDAVTPLRHQKKTTGRIGGQLAIIKGVGHLSHYETPAKLAGEISRFLR